MVEADAYLKQAASSFKLAEAHLKDAEDELRRLVDSLEDCAEFIKKIPRDELLLWGQVDAVLQASQPAGAEEMEPVNY